jgi:hypothetical protein
MLFKSELSSTKNSAEQAKKSNEVRKSIWYSNLPSTWQCLFAVDMGSVS